MQPDLPTEDQMLRLKQELNLLLWTADVPPVPPELRVIEPSAKEEKAHINIQCVAHAVVTCGLFLRRGFRVTTRGGMAFVLERSPDGNPDNDRLEQIAKHWWLTLDDYGLVDLSLNGETEHPLIYQNRSPGSRWRVEYGEDPQKLDRFLNDPQQGCFYLTAKKQQASLTDLQRDLTQRFGPARRQGIALSYGHILKHIEDVLSGAAPSLLGSPQPECWRYLASTEQGK